MLLDQQPTYKKRYTLKNVFFLRLTNGRNGYLDTTTEKPFKIIFLFLGFALHPLFQGIVVCIFYSSKKKIIEMIIIIIKDNLVFSLKCSKNFREIFFLVPLPACKIFKMVQNDF